MWLDEKEGRLVILVKGSIPRVTWLIEKRDIRQLSAGAGRPIVRLAAINDLIEGVTQLPLLFCSVAIGSRVTIVYCFKTR